MQLNPARGRKLLIISSYLAPRADAVYAAQPREGTETLNLIANLGRNEAFGLCSSTPRGDGNTSIGRVILQPHVVYAAQPREGTETYRVYALYATMHVRFMQLNPARGRKPSANTPHPYGQLQLVYAAQPREGTETLKS